MVVEWRAQARARGGGGDFDIALATRESGFLKPHARFPLSISPLATHAPACHRVSRRRRSSGGRWPWRRVVGRWPNWVAGRPYLAHRVNRPTEEREEPLHPFTPSFRVPPHLNASPTPHTHTHHVGTLLELGWISPACPRPDGWAAARARAERERKAKKKKTHRPSLVERALCALALLEPTVLPFQCVKHAHAGVLMTGVNGGCTGQGDKGAVCCAPAAPRSEKRGPPVLSLAPLSLPFHTGRQDGQPHARHPGRQAGAQHLRGRVW